MIGLFNTLNSLTARIFAIFWFTLALVLLLVLMLPRWDSRNVTELSAREKVSYQRMANQLGRQLQALPADATDRQIRLSLNSNQHSRVRVVIQRGDGLLLGSGHMGARDMSSFVSLSEDLQYPRKKLYDQRMVIGPFIVFAHGEMYRLFLSHPTDPKKGLINYLIDHPITLLAVTMLSSTPFLLWLAWSLARPARRLQRAANKVAGGELTLDPLLERGSKEFRAAGRSFNQMVSVLEQMVGNQQRLLSDISHELRTPLTRLQLATALVRRRQGESSELARIETEAQRLDGMIGDLLALSRLQLNSHLDREALHADELWEPVLDDATFEAEQSGKTLVIEDVLQPWPLSGNRALLESALENVIRNALRYAYHTISLRFQCDTGSDAPQMLHIFIDDDGPGVPPEEREKIFRPFYRTDEARTRTSGGTGLGLAIVDNAIRQHRGTISASTSPQGGLRVIISLPLAD
ncbi:MAG: envelope stress sensor histidine kinase CpxA [Plesiomonas sp.]|uniref:envelope stress sensor histidine kinase CpxA n=1 Tax=Plesiomonas sp. TaxID=2486279 RepID=UPI003F2A152E